MPVVENNNRLQRTEARENVKRHPTVCKNNSSKYISIDGQRFTVVDNMGFCLHSHS